MAQPAPSWVLLEAPGEATTGGETAGPTQPPGGHKQTGCRPSRRRAVACSPDLSALLSATAGTRPLVVSWLREEVVSVTEPQQCLGNLRLTENSPFLPLSSYLPTAPSPPHSSRSPFPEVKRYRRVGLESWAAATTPRRPPRAARMSHHSPLAPSSSRNPTPLQNFQTALPNDAVPPPPKGTSAIWGLARGARCEHRASPRLGQMAETEPLGLLHVVFVAGKMET